MRDALSINSVLSRPASGVPRTYNVQCTLLFARDAVYASLRFLKNLSIFETNKIHDHTLFVSTCDTYTIDHMTDLSNCTLILAIGNCILLQLVTRKRCKLVTGIQSWLPSCEQTADKIAANKIMNTQPKKICCPPVSVNNFNGV